MPANIAMSFDNAMPANTAMPMFLTGCETDMRTWWNAHMEI